MKIRSKTINPNPFHIWLNLEFGPNHQNSWDRSTKLMHDYRIECFDEHGDWENGWGTAEELHQEVAELHLKR